MIDGNLHTMLPEQGTVKGRAFQFCLFFQPRDTSTVSARFSSFLIKKHTKLGASANKQPFYLCWNSAGSLQRSDAVQDLAGSPKPFPPRLPYQTPLPSNFLHQQSHLRGTKIDFLSPYKTKSRVCAPCLLRRETNNATTRST